MKYWRLVRLFSPILVFLGSVFAQTPQTTQGASQPNSSSPQLTFRSNIRLVTVEVVARDNHGQPVKSLTADDFQVFEQVEPKRDQHQQKITAFRTVDIATIAAQDIGAHQLPPGVYTNLATMNKQPVPPTILLIDGLNTDSRSHLQVHAQMTQMLAALPKSTPVAVFLLGRQLEMVQNFTSDPELLKAALLKARTATSNIATQVEPRDEANAISVMTEQSQVMIPTVPTGSPGDQPDTVLSKMAMKIAQFERENYSDQMDTRVLETLEALRAIARYVAGYAGRKNLLWISSSFPIGITPDVALGFAGVRNYQAQLTEVTRALAEAKVAVYPMDPAGMQTQSMFDPGSRMGGNPNQWPGQVAREDQSRFDNKLSMDDLAEATGGAICVQDNDLGDCVKKAIRDSSSFYEIEYYPDSGRWEGEFHKIVVKSNKSGVHLGYRRGYYAQAQAGNDPKSGDRELQEAACNDVLTSTAVLIVARQIPADQTGKAKYFMGIHPATLTFTPQSDGSRALALKIGVCGFDKTGKAIQFMAQTIDSRLTDKEFAAVQAQHGVPDSVSLEPVPGVASVRLLVEDVATGKMGSVNLPYADMAAGASTSAPTPQTPH